MKTLKTIYIAMVSLFFICAIPVKNIYNLSKDYAVTIDGTSNLHNWSEKVNSVSGNCSANISEDGTFDLNALVIKMEVHSIKSDHGSTMNNNTYKALKADANPQIIFTLTAPLKSIQSKPNQKMISAKGKLTIAGATQTVEMQVKISMPEPGKLIFEGSQPIKMSDYNIDPPTALFGVLKTGDAITINFKTSFALKAD